MTEQRNSSSPLFLILLLLGCFFFLPAPLSAAEKSGETSSPVIFSRDGAILLTDTAGAKPVNLSSGYDPEISPGGTDFAFTLSTEKDDGRKIALFNIKTKKRAVPKSIPGNNNYGPRWSPDGKALIFNYWVEKKSEWGIGHYSLGNGKFKQLAPELLGVYSPFWSADGLSVYCHDLDNLYRIDLSDGKVAEMRKLSEVLGEAMPSSGIHFSVSPDGSKWLFDGEVEDTGGWQKTGDGLIGALFLFLPGEGTTTRITSDRISALSPSWKGDGEEYLFFGFTEKEMSRGKGGIFGLFRSSISQEEPVLFLPNGETPSAPRGHR